MPGTILHIDSSARDTGSVTRDLSARIVARLDGTVIRRDLAEALPLIDAAWVTANTTPPADRSEDQQATLALSDRLIEELRAADTIVIGLPVYNFGMPAALKAWVDLVCRAGVTFRYSAEGPVGLLEGKRAIVVAASGGTPVGSEMDFATTHLRHVLGFIGIKDVTMVAADRMALDADAAVSQAHAEIERIAA